MHIFGIGPILLLEQNQQARSPLAQGDIQNRNGATTKYRWLSQLQELVKSLSYWY